MAFGIGTSRRPRRRAARQHSGRLLVQAVTLALVVPLGLAQVAEAQGPGGSGNLGRPHVPKPRVSKVKVFDGPGAQKARQKVAQDKQANNAQAQRARTERKAAWPQQGEATLNLAPGKTATATPAGVPVTLNLGAGKASKDQAAAQGTARVTVLNQKAARKAGITGVLLTAEANRAGAARVAVDYSGFASAIGGGWAQRLSLVQLPACALTTPQKAECRKETPLTSNNDISHQTLSAQVNLAAAPGARSSQPAPPAGATTAQTVLAVTAATSTASSGPAPSGTGNYTATPLSASSSWQAGGSSGAFTWSYDFTAPPAAAGPVPPLSLSYDSGSIDGRTATTNNQGTSVGEGFTLTESYIERTYGSCDEDGHADLFDLCWKYDNARLVLNGKSTRLVKDDDTGTWRLEDDDASKVTRSTGASNGDDNGEYWTITTGDGTKYVFGQDKLDGADTQRTNSTWTVAVFGDDSGEPGYSNGDTFDKRSTVQAWRWNLDYVEDPDGNAAAYWYTKESNYYKKNKATTASSYYIRGGYLDRIEYGLRKNALFTDKADARFTFGYTERCTAADCSSLTKDTAQNWPDVPFDAICAKDNADCNATSPSFFTRKRLTSIATSSYNATSGAYDPVDSWAFTQEYLDGGDIGDSSDQVLTLKSLTRTGKAGDTSIALKPISFTYQMRSNRVDATDNILPMTRPRISTVTSETGAITRVTLSAPECVRSEVLNAAPDTNTRSCYPQYWHINGAENASIDWFHKYRVLAVTVADPAANNEAVEYAYSYSGAAWHYADDPITPKDERTWSDWRGYRQVTTWTGATDVTRSKSVSLYLQGMDGDKNKDGTTKSVPVAPLATPSLGAASITDSDQYAGQLREQVTFDSATAISATVNDPWSQETARQSPPDAGDHVARYVRTKKTHNYTYLTASSTWRERQTEMSFDNYGMPVTVDDYGQIGKGSDETCTRTWYARNTDVGITSLTSRTRTVARQCSTVDTSLSLPATSATSGDVLSDTATVYDTPNATGWTSAQKPTKGQATWTGRATGYAATADLNGDRLPTGWQTVATTTFDTLGRPLSITDSAGHTTSTAYTPADAGPLTKTITTDPQPMQYKAVSFLDPRRGLTLRSYDINLQKTEQKYDALGRLTNVWLPNRDSSSQSPNTTFDYHLDNTKPSWVSTATLKSDGTTYNTSYAIYDALLRPLQTQAPTPLGGRLLTDTRYDTRGLAYETYADIYDTTSTPNGTYTRAEYGEAPQQKETVFDGAGRGTTSTLNVFGKEKWSTTTSYTGDSVATTALEGGSAQRTITDVRGRTVESREYAGTDPADSEYGASPGASYTSTKFTYGPDGRQDAITGPDNTKWTYVYDLYGRQISTTDPDKGTTTTEYNALDQVTKSTDSLQQSVLTDYDELGRITGTWSGSKTDANQLTAYTYDSVHKGLPTSSTRYVGGKAGDAYTQTVTAYDTLDRATNTQLEMPANDPFVKAGQPSTLTFETYYKIDGTLNGTKAPAAGGLPSEAIDYHYDGLGDLTSFGGATGYLLDVSYSALAQPLQLTLGTGGTGNKSISISNTFEEGTNRLTRSNVTDQTHPYMLQDLNYTYDESGNVTAISDPTTLGGTSSADTQCFAYDSHQRLLEAWTPTSQKCTDTRDATSLSGPAPYWTSYTYNAAGQRATETTHTTSGNTKTTYCYTNTKQPHTLRGTTTGTDCTTPQHSYDYDTTGNTIKRPGQSAGHNQDLAWSPEGQLSKLTEDDKSTDYIYDAAGNLLIRTTEDGERILYAGATELHLRTDGTTWAQRYYAAGGITAAVRSNQTGTSKLTYLAADQRGTSSLAISPDTSQTYTKRYTTPFGEDRGTPLYGPWPDDKGFLGKTSDATTGLTHIGAREYDPTIGQFLSVDPILDTSDAQSLNGYSYADNNPATFSDPTGQWLDDGTGHSESPTGNNRDDVGVPRGGTQAGGCYYTCNYSSSGTANSGSNTEAASNTKATEDKLLKLGPQSNDADDLKRWWYVYSTESNGDYWNLPVGEGNHLSMACYGRTGCRVAWNYLNKTGDVPGAKKLAATYCLHHAEQCDNEARMEGIVSDTLQESLQLIALGVGGGKYGCKCFLAGTDVLMADGKTKDIEKVKVGDTVLATDPETGTSAPKKVTRLIVTDGDKYFNELFIAAKDGVQHITATHEHPFWSPSERKWVEAGNLVPGMTLLTDDGTTVKVTANHHFTRHARTYNLTVDDLHTYYVLAGQTPVLVHNSSCWVGKGGPGTWGTVNEAMSARAAAYQTRVTGVPRGFGYTVNGVKFDGFQGGTLLDAKGPGYAGFVKGGRFRSWYNGADSLADQAQRQLNAAGGTPITWHVAEADAVTAMRNLFADRGISGINIVHTP
ncbi:polymorphic toxin-type HINT domain-containing protein [Streptomyces sp. EKR5.2]|uniref:polymorphic toxin-type HINT domain-containing protein n=1 Tax=Streptomyces sp. EKR5.2 TaxID=3461014 RepID=UPI0040421D3D